MKNRLDQGDARALSKRRRQTVQPVFGIIEGAVVVRRFHFRGLANAASGWTLVTLADTCCRMNRMLAAA